MRALLMTAGVILGVLGGAYPRERALVGGIPGGWPLVAAGAACIAAALVLRLRGARVSDRQRGSIAQAQEAVRRAPEELRALSEAAVALPIAELAARLDAFARRNFDPVYEAQEALVASQGFAKYAAHTGPWANGERMVSRAWSAATDGHRPEAVASIREAMPHFEEAAKDFA